MHPVGSRAWITREVLVADVDRSIQPYTERSSACMTEVTANLGTGQTEVGVVPTAAVSSGHVLARSRVSLVSPGTERMLVQFGRANLLDKVRQQPDKVRQVLEKIRTDGLAATLESVRAKLDQPIPLGYSNAGVVLTAGTGVADYRQGDRIVSNGNHAEIVTVPANLCASIPASVSDDEAAFTVVAAIALQGIRLAQPTLGECFAVTGLGLIGLVTVQILRAHGCRVLGIDLDSNKLALAANFGADVVDLSKGEDPVAAAESFSRGRGLDGVIITAATRSNEPVHQAAIMCRKRGRIVLTGVTGLELSRDDFYKKELSFQVSCSYGPGRYDPAYENGHDYPIGFVRWTAQRNFEAVLDMMASGSLDVKPLITHRFPIKDAASAYELFFSDEPYLGILLEYPGDRPESELLSRSIDLSPTPCALHPSAMKNPSVAVIGAGGYATKVLIPALRNTEVNLAAIASSSGLSCAHAGRKFGFARATTDIDSILGDSAVSAVVIATRHDSHAGLVCRALEAGKHVFVEKPLATTTEDLERIQSLYTSLSSAPLLMVGFNRRFAPHIMKMHSLLAGVRGPRSVVITVNAGAVPADHWTQDPEQGGGRIIGEACHFIDLARFLAGSPITALHVPRAQGAQHDSLSFVLEFENGSSASIQYIASGHKSFPKERVEVFAGGRILQLENFRRLRGWGWRGFRRMNLWRQDKGNADCVAAFVDALWQGDPSPIPFGELMEVSRTTLEVNRLATRG